MDGAIVQFLYGLALAQPWLGSGVVLVAEWGIFLLPIAMLGAWLAPGPTRGIRRRAVIAGCLAALAAAGLGLVLEHVLSRERPFVALGIAPLIAHASDSSFPSDHTLVGAALVGACAILVPRVGLWLLAWAVLVGAARVMAALHFPSDVVGSVILALGIDGLALLVVNRLVASRPQNRPLRRSNR